MAGIIRHDVKAGATAASLIVVTLAGAPDLMRFPWVVSLDDRIHRRRHRRWIEAQAHSERAWRRRSRRLERAIRVLLFYALLPLGVLAAACALAASLLSISGEANSARAVFGIAVLIVAGGGWFLLALIVALSIPTAPGPTPDPETVRVSLSDVVTGFIDAGYRRTLGALALLVAVAVVVA